MWLDERLLEIGRAVNMADKKSIVAACMEMAKACLDDFQKSTPKVEGTDLIYIDAAKANIRRIDGYWRKVAKQLALEGKGFISPDGWRYYVETRDNAETMGKFNPW